MTHQPNAFPKIQNISPSQPIIWLVRAWRDMQRLGWVSYLHGLTLAVGGLVIVTVTHNRFWILAGALSGFMVVAPVLATSLYALSRALEDREKANFSVVVKTWLNWHNHSFNKWGNDYWCMVQFGTLLGLASTGWVITSAALITLLSPVAINSPLDFVKHVVLAPNGWLFELWLAIGGLMAAPMFASSVVSMPLLLDRHVSLMQAVLTSWRTVLHNPGVMALWAAIIMGLTLLAMSTLMIGLIPIIPLLGHASWHAYRDLVDASDFQERKR